MLVFLGWFTHSPSIGSAMLCCPDEVQGLLSQVLQLVKERVSSFAIWSIRGKGEGTFSHPHQYTTDE